MFAKPLAWLFLGSLLTAVSIVSCGKDICFMGQGDCQQQLTSTTLTLKSSADTVGVGLTVTFTPAGGSGTYNSYLIKTGGGSLSSQSGVSTVLTAPTAAATVCVRVTDSAGATADRCVTVQ